MTESVETIRCSNCKRDIRSTNFVIHEVHCQRNIYICSKCNEPVNHNQRDEHDEANHVLVFCTGCHSQVEKYLLSKHMKDDCSQRKVKCQICDIEIGACDISEHENYCGARTEKCLECGEFVMMKYKQLHIDSNHTFIKLSDEPGPSPSWQNGRRTLGHFFPDLQSRLYTTSSSHQKKRVGRSEHEWRRAKGSPEFVGKDKAKDLTSPNGKQKYHNYQGNIDSPGTSYLRDYRRRGSDYAAKSRLARDSEPDEAEKPNAVDSMSPDLKGTKSKGKERLVRVSGSSTKPKPSETLREPSQDGDKWNTDDDSSLALALQLSEELNDDFDSDNDKLIAQAIDENAAVLSEFTLFDKNNVTSDKNLAKNIYTSKTPNKTKSHLKYRGDDSSDDEFFLYANTSVKNVDDVSLPCQFCESLYPSYSLMSHQSQCRSKPEYAAAPAVEKYPHKRPVTSEKETLCELCYRLIPVSQFDSHLVHLHSTKK